MSETIIAIAFGFYWVFGLGVISAGLSDKDLEKVGGDELFIVIIIGAFIWPAIFGYRFHKWLLRRTAD